MKKIILFLLVLVASVESDFAKTVRVGTVDEFKSAVKKLVAGDSLVMQRGVWTDASLVFTGQGDPDRPICLTVEEPGETTLEGASCLRIGGKYLHISGLVFKNGSTPRSTVIEFKVNDQTPAYYCTLSECVIDTYNKADKTVRDCWIGLWGQHNTVEYCYFGGKSNQGTTCIVWPNGEGHAKNFHHIYRNYFGYRPDLGNNGGETIRIGTSQYHREASNTLVEENYFEHCNGEVEIISVKSCENRIVRNTFFECEGAVTLRHGNDNEVSGNFFYGNNKPSTGGVRIINQGHRVYNNLFYQLKGKSFRAPLVIMNGIPDSPDNGYVQVSDVVVCCNTFIGCSLPFELCAGSGERGRTLTPQNTLVAANLIYAPDLDTFVKCPDDASGIAFRDNIFHGAKGVCLSYGGIDAEPYLTKAGRFQIIYSRDSVACPEFVTTDILGRQRDAKSSVGAFLPFTGGVKLDFVSKLVCGPAWYVAEPEVSKKYMK